MKFKGAPNHMFTQLSKSEKQLLSKLVRFHKDGIINRQFYLACSDTKSRKFIVISESYEPPGKNVYTSQGEINQLIKFGYLDYIRTNTYYLTEKGITFANYSKQTIAQADYNLSDMALWIETHFLLKEISLLCFKLNIKYENLSGDTISQKSVELVDYMYRCGRLQELIDKIKESRPLLTQEFLDCIK